MFRATTARSARRGLPRLTLDDDVRPLDADQVPGVGFVAAARRGCGAGLHQNGRVVECRDDGVVSSCAAWPTWKCPERIMSTRHFVNAVIAISALPTRLPVPLARQVERMMRDDDARDVRSDAGEPSARSLNLHPVDVPIFPGQRAGGAHPLNGDLVVGVERLHVAADVLAVFLERRQPSAHDVVQRHIVVARDDDLRKRQAVEKGAGGGELQPARPLREIAGDHHDIGPCLQQSLAQRRQDESVDAPEVQIGNVGDGAHGSGVLSFPRRHNDT